MDPPTARCQTRSDRSRDANDSLSGWTPPRRPQAPRDRDARHRPYGACDGRPAHPAVHRVPRRPGRSPGLPHRPPDRADARLRALATGRRNALRWGLLHLREPDRGPPRRFPDRLAVLPLCTDNPGVQPGDDGLGARVGPEGRVWNVVPVVAVPHPRGVIYNLGDLPPDRGLGRGADGPWLSGNGHRRPAGRLGPDRSRPGRHQPRLVQPGERAERQRTLPGRHLLALRPDRLGGGRPAGRGE